MMLRRMTGGGLAAVMAAVVMVAVVPTARAQTPRAPVSARDVLLLVTEKVDDAPPAAQPGAQPASPTLNYWWTSPGSPKWSESDKIIRQELTRKGVELIEPGGNVGISKIYRRPNLSLANAATLGSLVGARRVLVGTIEYTHEEAVGPVGLQRVSAFADISLASAESGASSALQRFTVRRDGFAATDEEALTVARAELGEALSTLVAGALMRGAGPVGMQIGEQLIGLHNAENGQILQLVMQFLEGLDSVEDVRIRWASEGVIALEINPGKRDEAGTVEYAIRALASQPFEEFSLARRGSSGADGLAEFDISLRGGGSF